MNASNGKRRTGVLLGLTAALICLAALVFSSFHIGLDLTSDGVYSVSGVSKKLLKDLPDLLRITYYVSPDVSARYPGAKQVEDYLYKFQAAGRGKVSVVVADPTKDSSSLEGLGISPKRMQVLVNNEPRLVTVYSGLVIEYLDRIEAIPFVLGTEGLEYDLVKAVERAVSGKKAIAAVLVGDADKVYQNEYQTFDQALKSAGWDVQEISRGDAVPQDAQVLIVIGNADLVDYDVYRIDEFLARGGSAFMALRGVNVQIGYGLSATAVQQDALIKALDGYGLKLEKNLVLDPSARSSPFNPSATSGGMLLYPHWLVVEQADVDRKNPVTRRLSGLDLMWSSSLAIVSKPGVTAEPLVSSSKKAYLQTKNFAIGPDESALFDSEADSTTGQYLLAASLNGILPMAFSGKAIPVKEGSPPLAALPSQAKASRLLVISSADFLNDQYMGVQDLRTQSDATYNVAFAANAVEWLAYGDALATLKAQGSRDPRLVKVQDQRTRALIELLAIAVNIILVPGALVVFGVVRIRRRKLSARLDAPSMAEPKNEEGGLES